MKTFDRMAAQGDFIIMRIADLPANLVPLATENGKYVVAHSETGHNHVMTMDRVKGYKRKEITDDSKLFELFFAVEAPTEIEHLRSFDTHETIQVKPGNYVVKRQREYVAEGFRKAAD
jgi:hypothetical protein